MTAFAGTVAGAVGIALLLTGQGITQQQPGPSVDVSLTVERDGALMVTERVRVPRGEVRRSVPLRTPGAAGERVLTVERPRVAGTGNAEASEDTLTIRLGPGESTVSYVVRGAVIDAAGGQRVRWRIAGGWNTGLAGLTAALAAPAKDLSVTDCFAGPSGSARACTFAGVDHTGVLRVEQDGLAAGDRLDLVAGLPPGTVAANARFEPAPTLAGAFAITWVGGIALGVLALLLAAGALAVRTLRGRDAAALAAEPGPVRVLLGEGERRVFASPDGVLPGQVGMVLGERADPADIGAMVLDLAVRNYLCIAEVPGPDGPVDWRIGRRSPADANLCASERAVLAALLPEGTEHTTLSELVAAGSLDPLPIRAALRREVVRQGWLGARAGTGRAPLTRLGTGLAVAGGGLALTLAFTVGHALTGVALLLAGLALIAGSRLLPRRTARGRALAGQLGGLRRYLHEVDPHDLPAGERELVFARALPYAVALGETERWLRAFGEPAPVPDQLPADLPLLRTALFGLLAEAGHPRSPRGTIRAEG
ncbi:DUF2207 family protein [Amycolatopsis aidingensis]|uniref:DUF2207 family protein n=1 Tax=Amycolatopsis aidingensis TaxID=2842453 RepID=UPI001C0CDB18|nr:DUF2207 domain-containing protein [Amycolatopsis aidingensis]